MQLSFGSFLSNLADSICYITQALTNDEIQVDTKIVKSCLLLLSVVIREMQV